MTGKQRRFVAEIRDGMPPEKAAAAAGYTQAYAARLLEEPAIRAAIEREEPQRGADPQQAAVVEAPAGGAMNLEPADMLRSIINDPSQDNRVRITATRALAMLERDKTPAVPGAVIIDDVAIQQILCKNCPVKGDLLGVGR